MIGADKVECDSCSDKKVTIKVVEVSEWRGSKGDRYLATFGDYDLDCKVGLGETEEDVIDDLMLNGV